ncbi:MAG: GIY-YIG nuclease family protein [Bacteriovoracaceae bacterium]
MNSAQWTVYIIENEKGYLYTGITTDIDRRFMEHTVSKKGAKFFRTGLPVKILYTKEFPNRSLASKFEAMIKKLTRKEKIFLIQTKNFE